MKNDKQAWEYNEKHTLQHNHYNKQPNNTTLTQIGHQGNLTRNRARQTIAAEPQLSCRMENDKQAWEYNEKHTWQHNHYNKQPNNTTLTQIGHQGNLTWNRARQTIAGEIQCSWRMKNDKQAWEYNEKHMTIITTSNQKILDSLKFVSKPTSLGMVPVKPLPQRDKEAVE
jgi:hypothetical protein